MDPAEYMIKYVKKLSIQNLLTKILIEVLWYMPKVTRTFLVVMARQTEP